jgi:hypothetical protein
MLTDSVFWFVIFPFLTMKDYNRNFVRTLENASTLMTYGTLVSTKTDANCGAISLVTAADRNAFSQCRLPARRSCAE